MGGIELIVAQPNLQGKSISPGLLRFERTVIAELNSPVQAAQRYAIFQPLFGKKWQSKSIPFLLSSVRGIWNTQLTRLADIDALPGVQTTPERQLAYMRNCPGCTVLESPRMLFCRQRHFCPFCYARDVVMDAYCRLADVIGLGRIDQPVLDGHVLGIRARVLIPSGEGAALEAQRFVKSRRLYRDAAEAISGLTGFVVQPSTVQGCWELSRLELLIVPHIPDATRMQLTLPGCVSYYQQALTRWNRIELASLVGSIFEYPAMLLLGSASEVGTILWAIHGLRMRSAFGSMWGVKVPSPDEADRIYV